MQFSLIKNLNNWRRVRNDIKNMTIVRMEVPCYGRLQKASESALRISGKFIPRQVVTVSHDGNILD